MYAWSFIQTLPVCSYWWWFTSFFLLETILINILTYIYIHLYMLVLWITSDNYLTIFVPICWYILSLNIRKLSRKELKCDFLPNFAFLFTNILFNHVFLLWPEERMTNVTHTQKRKTFSLRLSWTVPPSVFLPLALTEKQLRAPLCLTWRVMWRMINL